MGRDGKRTASDEVREFWQEHIWPEFRGLVFGPEIESLTVRKVIDGPVFTSVDFIFVSRFLPFQPHPDFKMRGQMFVRLHRNRDRVDLRLNNWGVASPVTESSIWDELRGSEVRELRLKILSKLAAVIKGLKKRQPVLVQLKSPESRPTREKPAVATATS